MKKLTKAVGILVICASLSASPAMAQTSDNASSGTTTNSDNHDNSGKWGLLGLAGLLGLLGRKKDDDRHRNTTVNR